MQKLKKYINNILLFTLLYFFTQNSFASNRNLTIFAEQNMVQALTKIVTLYSQKNNVTISINFNSSFELIDEIDLGEPADVFISGHSGLIETLKQKGLVDVYNVSYIAQDRLALVTSRNNPNINKDLLHKNLSFEDSLIVLDKVKASVVIDQAESTSGLNSDNIIKSLKLKKLKLFKKLPEDKTAIFSILHRDNENYAILLASQVKSKEDLLTLATSEKDDIFYQALVVAGNNMTISREFLKFLKGTEAQAIFKENSFIIN